MKLFKAACYFVAISCCVPVANAQQDTTTSTLHIELPAQAVPFPNDPATGEHPGFKLRGTKGWAWTPEQYMEEIPWLVKFKMNFLMNCYVSLFTSSAHPWNNEWWKPLPDTTKNAYANIIHACQTNNIKFCFCMNPQLASKRPLNPTNTEDLDILFQHYAWAQSLGVKWFSICVDDVIQAKTPAEVAAENAFMVNTILSRLRAKDPEAQMIFCPGPYHGDGSSAIDHAYLTRLGHDMSPDVYVFWVGDETITPRITRAAAESYKKAVNHRLIIWDNYPVNDYRPTMSLGPVNGRAQDLCEVTDGYMSNPMDPQSEINRIPLSTCADYANDPRNYNSDRSIGQAILLFGKTSAQQEVLKELVEAYPGFIVTGGGSGNNPVRKKFKQLAAGPDPNAKIQFLHLVEELAGKMDKAFPDQFDDAKKSVAADIAWMRAQS